MENVLALIVVDVEKNSLVHNVKYEQITLLNFIIDLKIVIIEKNQRKNLYKISSLVVFIIIIIIISTKNFTNKNSITILLFSSVSNICLDKLYSQW